MINEEKIKEAVNRLVKKFQPKKIILFGSHARGTADKKSDVDLLVICPIINGKRPLMTEMDKELWGLELPRDIIVMSEEEFEQDKNIPGTIARPAYLEGKILYQSGK